MSNRKFGRKLLKGLKHVTGLKNYENIQKKRRYSILEKEITASGVPNDESKYSHVMPPLVSDSAEGDVEKVKNLSTSCENIRRKGDLMHEKEITASSVSILPNDESKSYVMPPLVGASAEGNAEHLSTSCENIRKTKGDLIHEKEITASGVSILPKFSKSHVMPLLVSASAEGNVEKVTVHAVFTH